VMEQGEIIADGSPEKLRDTLNLSGELTLDNLLRGAIKARRGEKEPVHE
jgi:hypothetical protein